MASYAEDLTADPARLIRVLEGLVAEHEIVVRRLNEDLDQKRSLLDRAVMKLVLFSEQLGRSSTDTTLAQRDAEDANTPVVELGNKLQRAEQVLDIYRRRLDDVKSGRLPDAAAQQVVAAATEGV